MVQSEFMRRINRKQAEKQGRALTGRRNKKRSSVDLIKRVIRGQLETKYVAEQQDAIGVPVPGGLTPSVNYIRCLTPVSLQTDPASNNVREGNKIQPTRASVNIDFWMVNGSTTSKTIFVKVFFLQSKSVKSGLTAQLATLPSGFLESGAADPVQWVGTTGALQRYFPVCKDNYTILKIKTIKLTKNGGEPIGENALTPYVGGSTDRKSVSFTWRPPTLKYGLDSDIQPQNHAPFFMAVAYSPGFIYTTDESLMNSVNMTWQTNMYFKDA